MAANSFKNGEGKNIKIGDAVTFKLDYEGSGKVARVETRESFMGTRVEVVVEIAGHEHAGFERWDAQIGSYVVYCETNQVWK